VDIYTQKKRWKILLMILAIVIISASIFYTNLIVNQFAKDERRNVRLWAAAVHRKAELVRYTEFFFSQLQEQERTRVEMLAKVYRAILADNPDSDLTFYLDIISNNKTIPIILTNEEGRILNTLNLEHLEYFSDTTSFLTGLLKEEFSKYPPIEVPYAYNHKNFLYYQDSRFFRELKSVLNDYITSFMSEVALNSSSVPVIITDSTQNNVIQFGNLNDIRMSDPAFVRQKLDAMKGENQPIVVTFGNQGTSYIFYQDSELLTIMKFFPLAQILIIAVFLLIAYLLFSYARRSEQNRVWAGMAKETAHQIGTPLSSIMAWLELLKMDESNAKQAASEIEKDVNRLEVITERFSKVGSTPALEKNDLIKIIYDSVDYLKPRSPKKIEYNMKFSRDNEFFILVNAALFSWVIENICKNAIDAMSGEGTITISILEEGKHVNIDFSDTGKGIPKNEHKSIFNPGFTSKKRGWGLGLSLAKRIIRDYHKGKIFVKNSTPGKGSTFRVVLYKS
jgi:signal transduction histidine kinase